MDGITVFEVEADRIRKAHAELLRNAEPHPEGKCAFLDSDGVCRIYHDRPYVCRTQGLPLRWVESEPDGSTVEHRDICPLNDAGTPITDLDPGECWLLGPYEGRIAHLQSGLDGGEMRRVPLRSLFAGGRGAERNSGRIGETEGTNMKKLTGKRVLITGAARGIGLEMAIKFAESGSEIVLTDLREDALPEAREIVEVLGVPVHTFALDVTDTAAIIAFKSRLDAEVGPVDLLVNNAGVVFGGPFADVPLEKHVLTYKVNVLGAVAMTHAFLPDLISRPEAHLVNIASASGFIGLPYGSTYASSKWAVIGFSESIRAELDLVGHDHVNVTTVCPSYIGTGMFEGVKPPTSTRLLAPEQIAARIVEAVQADQAYVLEPWLVKLTPPLKAFLPTRLFDMVASVLGANTGMSGWTGHDDAPARTGRRSKEEDS